MSSEYFDPQTAWEKWQPSDKQPWNHRRAAHLVRRAGFGVTFKQLDSLVESGFESAFQSILTTEGRDQFDQTMKPMERVLTSSQDPRQLASWWLLRMLQTPCQLLEKTTLFWHGHFATGAEKVANARAMLKQNELLRRHALGKFEPMIQGISRDVAMLIYLDSEDNRKTRPNENYARELMELFCLGPGNYSENDIKELARCFTGWQIKRGRFRFNKHQHDKGEKAFLNSRGDFSGEQAIRIVINQPAAPEFIVKKLLKYFVADDLNFDELPIQKLVDPLVNSGFDIGSTVRTILGSNFFFSENATGRKVRSPVEMAIGMLRSLDAKGNMNSLGDRLLALGHLPLYPPNVKGWDGGRLWINASTYFGRANLVRELAEQEKGNFERGSISRAVGASKGVNSAIWVQRILDAWIATEIPESTHKQLLELGSQSGRSMDQRVIAVISAIGATPEFQLS